MPKRKTETAALFQNGGSQAVRLPRTMHFAGDRVRVRRVGRGVLLEPLITDPTEWFAQLDERRDEPFVSEGRRQPRTPRRKIFGTTR